MSSASSSSGSPKKPSPAASHDSVPLKPTAGDAGGGALPSYDSVSSSKRFFRQFHALSLKSFHVQRRQHCENCCSIVVPAIIMAIVSALTLVFASSPTPPNANYTNPQGAFAPLPFPPNFCDDNSFADSSGLCAAQPFPPYPALEFPTGAAAGTAERVGFVAWPRCEDPVGDAAACERLAEGVAADGALANKSGLMGGYSMFEMVYPPAVDGAFAAEQNLYDGSFLYGVFGGNAADPRYQAILDAENASTPYTDAVYGTTSGQVLTEDELNQYLYDNFLAETVLPKIFGAQFIRDLPASNSLLSAVVYYNESETIDCFEGWCQVPSNVYRLTSAFVKLVAPRVFDIVNYLKPMPDTVDFQNVSFFGLITSIMIGIIFHFLLPSFLRFLVYEKATRLRVMMQMMGLTRTTYWVVTYCFFLIQYGIMALLVTLIGAATGVPFFTQNTPIAYIALFFFWGNTMIAFCIFLAPFFRSPDTALVLGWFYVVIINLIGGPYVGQLYASEAPDSMFNAISILPSFAFFRSVYLMGAFNSGGTGVTLRDNYFSQEQVNTAMCGPDAQICTVYAFLAVEWLVLLLLGLYFDRVIPSGDFGVTDHPLFFLGFKRDDGFCTKNRTPESADSDASGHPNAPPDVVAETQRAAAAEPGEFGILLRALVKVWPTKPPKTAVDRLSLAVPRGEVFGMLGHNGAGKTTTINILTGVVEQTGGTALMDGLNIKRDLAKVYQRMGVCPQFDIQWGDMTAAEHLMFYGRLKLVDKAVLKETVRSSLESVQLEGAANKKVKNFSGGMKRRLSVAMALIGDPPIVILDEPTTGLDPKSKHMLWHCIQSRKAGKTIIITTHSMEEAERLCDRVGVMASGALECVGNPEELKLRLGRGYTLSVQLPTENEPRLTAMLQDALGPEVRIEATIADSVQYSIPRGAGGADGGDSDPGTLLGKAFRVLGEAKKELGLVDWGMSPSSLEDVFVELTKRKRVTEGEVTEVHAGTEGQSV